MTDSRQRVGLMVVTAWVEAGTDVRLTARIRRVADVADPKGREVLSAASSADVIHATIDSWLAELREFVSTPSEGDAAVTKD